MPRNGSGTYGRVAGVPYVYNTVIDQVVVNSEFDDIATALTASIAKDGQTTPTANLPMGGYLHTGVAAATARTHYARAAEVQDGSLTHLTSVSGADTITASAALSMSAYATGQKFSFVSAGANTGAATLNINSIGAKAITKNGTTALAAGDIPASAVVEVAYDGTQFQLLGVGLKAGDIGIIVQAYDAATTKATTTQTLTNKRITARVGSTTSSATPTINTDNVDIYKLTAQAEAITSMTTNLSGTPADGDVLIIEITGTAARAITWGSSFEASTVALPTTTVSTDMLAVGFIWNAVTSKWRCMAAV